MQDTLERELPKGGPITKNLKAREGIDHIATKHTLGVRPCIQQRVYNPAGGNPVK